MANTQSNQMLNNILSGFNTGAIAKGFKPGIPVGLIFAPLGTEFTEANMLSQSAFITALNALCITQGAAPYYSRTGRAYAFLSLDGFKPDTKKTAVTDSGLIQEKNIQFPNLWNFIVKGAQNNWSNFLNFYKMSNLSGIGAWVLDSNGNIWGRQSSTTPGNLGLFTVAQLFVEQWMPQEAGQVFEIPFSVHFANVAEFTLNFDYFVCPSLNATSIPGFENVVLQTAPAAVASAAITAKSGSATTDIVVIGKYGEGSGDFFQDYGSTLTAACFAGYDFGAAAAVTISTFSSFPITVAGVVYNVGYFHLSAAPTVTDPVQISTSAPATVYGVIANYVVTEVIQQGVDGANCAVKTF